ncbi:class I SAM-dependent methyltransferase [Aliiroseovarius sp. YM-037]|uniref:class I SAM-dependent methyltransferase n=1 Tax=Aliiroseovarius sp. YM-037 TaxID=3341728 RepID=UPI003A80222A
MSNDELIRHYQSLLEKHGPGSHAVQYADPESHEARFKVLQQVATPLTSVLDVGCGLAHFYHFLKGQGFTNRYHGVDIVPEFVDLANQSMADDDGAQASLMHAADELPSGYDYAVLSGVFNNRMDDNKAFMENTLRRMFDAADVGIAFNAMSTYVDYFDDGLYYVDPMEVFAFCKTELGGHPVLRHDYAIREGGFPFEFAMYVYKSPTSVE